MIMVLERQKMKNITIALPEIYVENIERLQEIGMVPSRSEAIRLAVREFLKKEMEIQKLLHADLGGSNGKEEFGMG